MLRPFANGDYEDYLAMSREFYASEATDHQVPEEHFQRTFDELVKGSALARGWIIIDENTDPQRPVGFLLATLSWSNEFGGTVAWLEELYLRPETRGRGLGRRVLTEAIEELKNRDRAVGFRLEVAPANESVSILYEKMGFTKVPYQEWWMAVK